MFTVRRVDREVVENHPWDTDCLVLVEERDQTGDFLMVQSGLWDDPQDADLGQDGPCVVRPDGECAYHAVQAYRLTRTSITFHFTSPAAASLALPERLTLALDLPEEDFEILRASLPEMLPMAAPAPQGPDPA